MLIINFVFGLSNCQEVALQLKELLYVGENWKSNLTEKLSIEYLISWLEYIKFYNFLVKECFSITLISLDVQQPSIFTK